MKKSILALLVLVSFIIVADAANRTGFISIDCGAKRDYVDELTGIWSKDDVYDRLWHTYIKNSQWNVLETDGQVKVENSNYELPSEILVTACQAPNNSNLLSESWSLDVAEQFYLFLHFAEIQKLPSGQKRIINVTFNYENSLYEELTLEYLKPVTLNSNITTNNVRFRIRATDDSYAPPILNAFEIFKVFPHTKFPNGPTRRHLGSSKLKGQISESFARLKNLECFDVTGNKLTGSIPKAFSENANLRLSVANNAGLYQLDSCNKERTFVIPLVTSITVFTLIAVLSLVVWRLRKRRQDSSTNKYLKMEIPKRKNREFSHSQVLRITNNFKTLIGEGGFGKVYLGTLEDNSQVAVKLLSESSKQGYKEFQSEAQLLTVIHHRNLVSLVGYCHGNNIMALIYEYVDNGDLGQLLSEKNSNILGWKQRLEVAIDAAKGLEYLHTGCNTPIIHRDLKPSNILLNKSMVAKIADFGLSRVFTNEKDTHLSTQPAGTPGYIDPEFQRSGKLNKKTDIYSFGMILLQLITGRPPIKRGPEDISFIIDWIQPKIESGDIEGIVDPRLAAEFSLNSTWKAVEVAMSCVLPPPTQRPTISYILRELQECLALEMGIHDMMPRNSCDYSGNIRFHRYVFKEDEDLSIAIGKSSKKEDGDLNTDMSLRRSILNFASFHLHYRRKRIVDM
ncbi:probable LRR receptor-like protein kinase At1g51890 [Neltuma alba]|uniref:probable LRR receptor-like protein kinase At1g51890 n=1 Tax=Neltuma alba TaxID=207710 RepID=UPI0010A41D73|nr:probable LRR receptor-like protein kinase At1g51890 [Prosopis alba]